MRTRWILAAVLVLSLSAAAGAAPATFSRADLLVDFDRAAGVLLSRNPLAFADKAELASFVESQRQALRDGMSELDLYRVLTSIVVKVRCGHTGIFLTPATEAGLRAGGRYLPILVRLVDGRLLVLSPLGAAGPPTGAEVTAINGRPAGAILAGMYDLITADGSNLTRKAYVAGRVFNDLYALFIDSSPAFDIEYLDRSGSPARVQGAAGISKDELERRAEAAGFPYGLPEKAAPYAFSVDHAGAPVLTVRTFFFPAGRGEYEAFIEDAFHRLRESGARSLVLDLRGNWGGDPEAASFLLARLLREPAPYFERGAPLYTALTRPLPLAPDAFGGGLVALIDGACFSSTGHLCSLLRFHQRAVFVGEETGGSWTCTDASRDYLLPRTGLRLHSSNSTFRTAVTGMPLGRGILPDYAVSPTMEDIAAGRDPVMEKAISLAVSTGE